MDRKRNKRTVRAVIIGGFILALGGLAIMGIRAYQSVDEMTLDLQKAAKEDPYLTSLKAILADLTTAESNVRAYTITHNAEEDLPECFRAIQELDQQIERIEDEELYPDRSTFEEVLELVSLKQDILEQLIETVDTGEVETTFEKFRAEIERLAEGSVPQNRSTVPDIRPIETEIPTTPSPTEPQPDTSPEAPTEEVKKEGFFKRLKFGRKKNRDKEQEALASNPPPSVPLNLPTDQQLDLTEEEEDAGSESDNSSPNRSNRGPAQPSQRLLRALNTSVSQLEQADIMALQLQRIEVANLTREGQVIMAQLKELVREVEGTNQRATEKMAQDAQGNAQKTYRFLILFGAAVAFLYLVLIAVIFSDFSRNARLTRKLENEKARAEKLARVKQEFLANMSHEIRTPMNAVIGFAEQLASTQLKPRQDRLLQPIRNSAHYLLALINDILDYSKLESGRFELDHIAFRPKRLSAEVLQTLRSTATQKGIALHQSGLEEIPPVLVGDPLRLRQMLFNLLGNAIKFTEKGSVTLQAELQSESPEELRVRFSVIDTGIGISQDQLEKVFQNFVQADSSTTRRFGGTGLGLSITQKLAKLHGGEIEIQSEVGQGTTVHLLLPYELGSAADLGEENQLVHQGPERLRGKRFLVADDEPYNRELMAVILEKWQVEADIVQNGREVIEKLEAKSYDLLLLDLQMPEMDGIEVAEHLQQHPALKVPILALTATFAQDEVREAMKSGMEGHLLKPFQETDLLAKSLELLGLPRDPEVYQPHSDLPSSLEEQPVVSDAFSLEHLRKLTNHNPERLHRMLSLFVQSTEEHLTELKASLPKQDWQEIGSRAHRLAPPSRHLGMDELVQKLNQLEQQTAEKTDWPTTESLTKEVIASLEQVRSKVKAIIEGP